MKQSPVGDGWIALLCGCPGSGKTTLLSCIVAEQANVFRRPVIALDPALDLARYMGTGHPVAGNKTVVHGRVETATTAAQATQKFNRVVSVWSAVAKPPAVVVLTYRSNSDTDERLRDELTAFTNDNKRRGLVVAQDEFELFCPNEIIKEERLKAVKLHRNRGQRWVATLQRNQYVNKFVRGLASHVCLFAQSASADLTKGSDAYGEPSVFLPALDLEKFEYLYRCSPMQRKRLDPLPKYSVIKDAVPFR